MDAALAKTTVEESYEDWKLAQWDGNEGVAPQGRQRGFGLQTLITSTSNALG